MAVGNHANSTNHVTPCHFRNFQKHFSNTHFSIIFLATRFSYNLPINIDFLALEFMSLFLWIWQMQIKNLLQQKTPSLKECTWQTKPPLLKNIVTGGRARSQNCEKRILDSCLSVRMEQLGSHWMNFHEISYLSILLNSVEKTQVSIKHDKNNGYCTLREHQYTFSIISRAVLVRMRNVSDKSCRENQTTHFIYFITKCFRQHN